MIKNEREQKITEHFLAKFEDARQHLDRRQRKSTTNLAILELQEAAAKSLISELKEQLDEYSSIS